MDLIKVSANSRTSAVTGAIAGIVREHHRAEVQAIGAGAVNQAIKALVLATTYLKNDGIFVTCVPEFADVTIEDKVRTAIKLVIEPTARLHILRHWISLSFDEDRRSPPSLMINPT